MAKVKITGHASGSGVITVTAPNTSTDRTITLPDSTGTILDENSSLPAANLTGTVATARLGSGTASSGTILYGDQTYKTAPTSFNPDAAVVINESGADVDFRVESDSLTHALFVQGSGGKVGIGTTPSGWGTSTSAIQFQHYGSISTDQDGNYYGTNLTQNAYSVGGGAEPSVWKYVTSSTAARPSIYQLYDGGHHFSTAPTGSADAAMTVSSLLSIKNDGRGLSQFTSKAWMRYDQDHNIVRDSHNVSSVTDHSLGVFTMNFSNNMGNNHYCVQGSGHYGGSTNDMGLIQWATEGDLTTSSAKFYFMSQINNGTSGALYDAEEAMILIFGD